MKSLNRIQKEHLTQSIINELISLTIFEPNPQKALKFLKEIKKPNYLVYLLYENSFPIGILIVTQMKEKEYNIKGISVLEKYQNKGFGRYIITEFLSQNSGAILTAETDAGSANFYNSLGFRINSLEQPSDAIQYECIYDPMNWQRYPYEKAHNIIAKAGIDCWIAGGWALDLFHGRKTREHVDTDILILRRDQLKLKNIFHRWQMYHTHAPGLRLWNGTEYLENIPNIWLRQRRDSPWSLEIMFLDTQNNEWIYKRDKKIRGKLAELGYINDEGISYLKPEIQLLYKGGSSTLREKDTADFIRILPLLSLKSKQWLATALKQQFPSGHEWLKWLPEI